MAALERCVRLTVRQALHGRQLSPDGRRHPFPRMAGALQDHSSDDRVPCAYQCPSPTVERGRRVFLSPYGHALISNKSVPVNLVARPSVFLGFILRLWQHVEDTSTVKGQRQGNY